MATKMVGLDIGSTSVRAVELSTGKKARPNLLRFHEVSLPTGAVNRGAVAEADVVVAALKRLWSEGGFKSKNVVLGTGDQRTLVRDLSVPKMSLKHIRESLPFQVQNMLQTPVADSLLDFYPISESTGDQGPVVNGLLIAVEASSIRGNIEVAEHAGLTPIEVDLIPFALNRLLVSRAQVPDVVALVDVGAYTTSMVVVVDGVPRFVRIIPAGGDDVTQALKEGLEIETAEAEKLKRTLGLVTESTTVPTISRCVCVQCLAEVAKADDPRAKSILQSVTTELLGSLRSTVSYFNNTWPQNPIRQAILTGGGAQLSGFAEALSELTRIPISVADPFAMVTLPNKRKGKKLQGNSASLATALGLALRSVS